MKANKQEAYKYINEYQRQKYDRITILRKAGEKEKIDRIAREKGFASTGAFVNACIDEKLRRSGISLED